MDAFAEGLVTTNNFGQARRIIAARAKLSKKTPSKSDYTVNQLQADIAESTRVKNLLCSRGQVEREPVHDAANRGQHFVPRCGLVELLAKQKLDKRPALAGAFRFEQPAEIEVQS